MALIEEACNSGARKEKACKILGITARTVQRWQKDGEIKEDQRVFRKYIPANKLKEEERLKILETSNMPAYQSLPPSQIVPTLADQGIYIASESSFYRVLKENGQLEHRGKAKPRTIKKPEPYVATGANQVWTWDITYLPTSVAGIFFYLYMIMDIYSRRIVGWEVYERQSDELASIVVKKACLSEGIYEKGLVLHSDNGSPMKGATMLVTLQKMGVVASFSRPSVSNDNPYSEALFRTLKYKPGYPVKPFPSIDESRNWVLFFVKWYNEEHKHSNLKFVSPDQRHRGEDKEILARRKNVYEEARRNSPLRWSGEIRNWEPEKEVYLNPGKGAKKKDFNKAA